MKRNIRTIYSFIFLIFVALIISFSLRGKIGNPSSADMNTLEWRDDGPFELSPERGRFALTYSVVEDKTLHFSLPVAKFAVPDLGYKNGNYVSLFAPGLSFITIPGYLLGKYLGASQVGIYAVIGIFAVINAILIKVISEKFGAKPLASTLGALTFIFATPAFAYGVSLYQHHLSTMLILLAIYSLQSRKNPLNLVVFWILLGISIPVDYPNAFLFLPLIYVFFTKIFSIEKIKKALVLNISLTKLLSVVGLTIPVAIFLWFNFVSYGDPLQLSGTVKSVIGINSQGLPSDQQELQQAAGTNQEFDIVADNRSAVGYFQSRDVLNGFYLHFLSPDRGIVYYSPVILFCVFGIYVIYKKKDRWMPVLLGIIGFNVLLYSLWGDPWGGWAFGSRYLIPSYAIASIFIAIFLSKYGRSLLFIPLFWIAFIYSVSVNTLGAVTSSANPPQVEVLELERLSGQVQKYTYERNLDYLNANRLKSFVFNQFFANKLSAWEYYYLLTGSIVTFSTLHLVALFITTKKNDD